MHRLLRMERLDTRLALAAMLVEHDGIMYAFNDGDFRLDRYDLADENWIEPITLGGAPGVITAAHVDDDGIYVADGINAYRYQTDGSERVTLPSVPGQTVTGLHSAGGVLYVSRTGVFTSIDKETNLPIDVSDDSYDLVGTSISVGPNKLFGRSINVFPSNIYYVSFQGDGDFTSVQTASPYHGQVPEASRTWTFPDGRYVTDDSGEVYSTADLTRRTGFGRTVSDIAFYGDSVPIVLSGNTVTAYSPETVPTGSITLPYTPTEIAVNDRSVITFTRDTGQASGYLARIQPLAPLNPSTPGQGIDPTKVIYRPDAIAQANDGTILILSAEHDSIFRWNPATQQYGQTISLSESPLLMAYSEANDTIYLAFASGSLRQIKMGGEDLVEEPFARLPRRPNALATAGPYVFAGDAPSNWSRHFTFAPDGSEISRSDIRYYSTEYIWSEANQKFYHLRDNTSPNDLVSTEVNADGVTYPELPPGGLGADDDSPLHGEGGFQHPVRVSPDGNVVLLGSGLFHDARTLARLPMALGITMVDATWHGDSLYTLRQLSGKAQLQRWSTPDYALIDSSLEFGTPLALTPLDDGRLLLTTLDAAGNPVFTIKDADLQTDYDGMMFSIAETAGATVVTEAGTTDTFDVVLRQAPTNRVVLNVTSGDAGEATVSPAVLIFTAQNWNTPRTVTVTGIADGATDGDQLTTVTVAVVDSGSDDPFDAAPDQGVIVRTVDAQTEVSAIVEHGGMGYFFVENGSRIERYDLATRQWIAPIALDSPADAVTAAHVDGEGIYIAYGPAVYRFNADGSNRRHLANAATPVRRIHSDGPLLLINHSFSARASVIIVDKRTNQVIDRLLNEGYSIHGSSIAPGMNRLFGRTLDRAPAKLAYVDYTDEGEITASADSPERSQPNATETWVSLDGGAVFDSSGTIYTTSDLTFLASLGVAIDDMGFIGDRASIVLTGNTLRGFSPNFLEVGSVTLDHSPEEIMLAGGDVITFTPDVNQPGGHRVRVISADPLVNRVVSRLVFYNNSGFDGGNPAANLSDYVAVARSKAALLPGQAASPSNYTTFDKGLNGVMIDLLNLESSPTAENFRFRVGNSADVASWQAAPAPTTMLLGDNRGASSSDRVTLIWADGAIKNQWLEITVLAGPNGLVADDVFYFGNAVGDTGNSLANAIVNATDEIAIRNRIGAAADIGSVYDINRDRSITAADEMLARLNRTTFANALVMLAAPTAGGATASAAGGEQTASEVAAVAPVRRAEPRREERNQATSLSSLSSAARHARLAASLASARRMSLTSSTAPRDLATAATRMRLHGVRAARAATTDLLMQSWNL